jgi:hypothetical protein
MTDTNGGRAEAERALEAARAETRAAFENRALMYRAIYEELASEIGEERASEIMKRAVHRRGLDVGRRYRAAAAARDLDEVGRIFCSESACDGALFHPGIEDRPEDAIVLRMTSCPLVDAWRAAGTSPGEIDSLCSIAAAVDEGTFEGAGLELEFLDRLGRPGATKCLLRLRLPNTGR